MGKTYTGGLPILVVGSPSNSTLTTHDPDHPKPTSMTTTVSLNTDKHKVSLMQQRWRSNQPSIEEEGLFLWGRVD